MELQLVDTQSCTYLGYYQQPADRMKVGCLFAHILLEFALTTVYIEIHRLRTVPLRAATGRQIQIHKHVVFGAVATTTMKLED